MVKSRTVKGLVWSGLERFSVQGIQFVLQIVMARLLTPTDYGIVGMLAIFLAISQLFIDSGFSDALIRKVDRTETDFSTVFYINIVAGFGCYGILFFSSPAIADFYKTPILESVTKIVAVNVFLNSLVAVQRAKLVIDIDFKTQAKVSLPAALISGISGVVLAYLKFGVWALAIQMVVNTFLNVLLLWIFVKWCPTQKFSRNSFRVLFAFSSKLFASGVLRTLYQNIYTLVIGKAFSAENLGYYTRANHFAQYPSSNVTDILQRVTYPLLCEKQNNTEQLRILYRKYIRLSAYIIFPLMMGLASVTKPLILIVLGEKWNGIIILLQILCFSLMWYPIHALNLNLLQVKGRSDLFLRLEIIKAALGVLTFIVTIPLGLKSICYGQIFCSLICLIINTHYTGKLIQVGFFVQMKDLFPSLQYSLSMFVIVFFTIKMITNMWLQLILGIIVGTFYYLLISYFTKSKDLKEYAHLVRGNT